MATYNPYEPLRQEALRQADRFQRLGNLTEMAWYQRMAEIHAKASSDLMQRTKEELQAKLKQPIPLAKIAPPMALLSLPVAKQAPPLVKAKQKPTKRNRGNPCKPTP